MQSWEGHTKPSRAESPLFSYAREGDVEAALALDPDPELINAKDAKGYSSLMLAAYHGHEAMTRLLLARGANPNDQVEGENSILMGAAFKGYLGIVKILVEAGADAGYRNRQAMTALNYAQMFGRSDVVEYLTRG